MLVGLVPIWKRGADYLGQLGFMMDQIVNL